MSVMTLPVTTGYRTPQRRSLDAQDQAELLVKLAGFLGVDVGGGWIRVALDDPGVWERVIPHVRLVHGGHADVLLEARVYYVRPAADAYRSDVTTEHP